ncbi:MAG: hypothetical protein ABI321_17565 [Polyangia bacterium]
MAEDASKQEEVEEPPSKIERFITKYSAFLGSFVIGVAGLVATSIWQWRQSEIAQKQSASQQKLAEIKADNDWRIERAEILSKNLSVLSSHGAASAEQRYGVLLSLTRGNILDPELAVSYALELGKDNPGYMRSVLASTDNKDYTQLLHAFALTCIQHYGVAKDVDACKNDAASERSDQISQLVMDEQQAANTQNKPGPVALLANENQVQENAAKVAWLFEPYLTDLYERRQFNDITRFEDSSPGAHLVGALDLATARTGEFVTSDEAASLAKFHSDQRRWLASYLFGRTCDADCKKHVLDVMVSVYGEAQGDYDDTLIKLLLRPRAEVGAAVGRLHQRILWCQIDSDDLEDLRDKVLVPVLVETSAGHAAAATVLDDILALLAISPVPTDPTAKAAFDTALDTVKKAHPADYQKSYIARRATADRERKDPPPAMKRLIFCNAADLQAVPGLPSSGVE